MRGTRKREEMRTVELEIGHNRYGEGSCLIQLGNTVVSCIASIENRIPYFLRSTGSGWITAEYAMLPRSTHTRVARESVKGQQSSRTQEIQRLIGRSLRAAVNLNLLGERQIIIDCDVIQADGGTRTAAITGGYVALYQAVQHLLNNRLINKDPIQSQIAAVSCGIVDNTICLDLEYAEDSNAKVDANFVVDHHSKLVEVQCTAERSTFSPIELTDMLMLATEGAKTLLKKQQEVLNIKRLGGIHLTGNIAQ